MTIVKYNKITITKWRLPNHRYQHVQVVISGHLVAFLVRHASVPVLVYSMRIMAKEQPSKRLQNKVDNNTLVNTIFTMFVVVINMLGKTESMNVATPKNNPVSTKPAFILVVLSPQVTRATWLVLAWQPRSCRAQITRRYIFCPYICYVHLQTIHLVILIAIGFRGKTLSPSSSYPL